MQSSNIRSQHHNGVTWIDISDPTTEQLTQVMLSHGLHPMHVEASMLTGHMAHVEKEDDYVFMLLHLPEYRSAVGKVTTSQVAIFLASDYLITIHHGSRSSIQHLFATFEHDKQLVELYFQKSPGYLLSAILDHLLDESSDIIQGIMQRLDEIEDIVFDDRITATYQIGQLRQRITKLKRLIDFLETLLTDLAPRIDDYTGEKLARYYRHTARTAQRLAMSLAEAKETVEIFKDADYTASNEHTNAILAVLTIIFTLTIPATLVGTFYGMNIPLPGGIEAGAWTFLGPYTTLLVALTFSAIPTLGMVWYFRKRKWF